VNRDLRDAPAPRIEIGNRHVSGGAHEGV
jgi:hypothetical protein